MITKEIINVGSSAAICESEVADNGGSILRSRGVCWSRNTRPDINDSLTIDGTGFGSFKSYIRNLDDNTTYFVSAYAVNRLGVGYGKVLSFKTQFKNVTTAGLVAHYPFNGDASDQTENHNNGLADGPNLTKDRFGYPESAYNFDGVDDNITGLALDWPASDNPRTISIWVKFHTYPPLNKKSYFLTYGPELDSQANGIFCSLLKDVGYQIYYSAYNDDLYGPTTESIGSWYNFVTTFDGTYAKIYVNGSLRAESDKSSWNTFPDGFVFGSNKTGSFLDGVLDDIRIYNRVLNQEEILQLVSELH